MSYFSTFYVLRTTYFFYSAFHIKRLLVLRIMLAFQYFAEAAHGFLERNVFPFCSGKCFSDGEWLRKEALDFACSVYQSFVFFGEFLDTQNRDDVLQVFVALEHAARFVRHAIVFFAHDLRRKRSRAGVQWIDGWIDTKRCKLAGEHNGGVEVREGRCGCGIGEIVGGNIYRLHR